MSSEREAREREHIRKSYIAASPALQRVEAFKQQVLDELLGQCKPEQVEFFYKLYPNGPRSEVDYWTAISQIERTLKKNQS